MAQDWRTLKLEVLAETKQFIQGMDKANATTKSFGDKLGDFAKKAALALAAVAAAAGAMAIKIGKDAVMAASDLAETTSKVNVIFGEAAKTIEKFGTSAAASLGQTRTQAMNAAATFGVFGKSAGLAGEDLAGFSTEFVTLASDLASFNNTSVDQAITALGAALRGESEPIRAYGVLLNDATLKAKAAEMGIYNGTGALSAQQKVLAAHQVILAQTRDAQGDFARTSDGLANQQRILTARLEEAKIVLGTALLPIVLQIIKIFNENFLPIIEKVAGSFGDEDGLIAQVKTFYGDVKTQLMPILDALGKSFDKVTQAVKDNKSNLKDVYELFQTVWHFFITYFVPVLKSQVVGAIEGIGTAFSAIIKLISPVIGVVSDAINGLLRLIDSAISRINDLLGFYNRVRGPLPAIGLISQTGGTAGGGGLGAPGALGGILGGGAAGGLVGGVSGGVGGGIGGTGAGATSKALGGFGSVGELTDRLLKIQDEIGALTFKYQTGQISKAQAQTALNKLKTEMSSIENIASNLGQGMLAVGSPVSGITGGQSRGENGPIVINVNAPSVMDETGFTRAVVDALNSVERRQGGGLSALVGL